MSIYAVAQRGLLKLCGTPLQGSLRCLDERRHPAPTTAAQPSRID
ncbi:hypothetical protein [Calidifontibacter indicus]